MNNQTRFWRILYATFAVLVIFPSGRVSAQSASEWSFSLLPASGEISGNAGSMIGWGYELNNLSSKDWLFVTDIQASGPFLYSTVDSTPFDYPILAPLSSVNVAYDNSSGLAETTWDTNAPVDFSNSGIFTMNADLYDGDPFGGGSYTGSAGVQTAVYRASVSPAAVPEAGTATGLSLGILTLLLLTVRRRLKSTGRSV